MVDLLAQTLLMNVHALACLVLRTASCLLGMLGVIVMRPVVLELGNAPEMLLLPLRMVVLVAIPLSKQLLVL
jgi:hypothetical protein